MARIKSFTATSDDEATAIQSATEAADTFLDGLAFDALISTHTVLANHFNFDDRTRAGTLFTFAITIVFERE